LRKTRALSGSVCESIRWITHSPDPSGPSVSRALRKINARALPGAFVEANLH